MEIIFLYLNSFSATGGIQKFNRSFIKAICEIAVNSKVDQTQIISMYDQECDQKYCNKDFFKGFNKSKLGFTFYSIIQALKSKQPTIILGHINLSLISILIKLFKPNAKIIMIAHGIEIWGKLSFIKKIAINHCIDQYLAVSNFTKNKIIEQHHVNESKIKVFHNTIDSYFEYPKNFESPQYLLDRYKISNDTFVFNTVARLSFSEKYKGYDIVIEALSALHQENPNLNFKYIIIGKYDNPEFERLKTIIDQNKLNNHVILTGFVSDEELRDHYLISDVFIMPSRKEGFGIVFIEAMVCGLEVIAGNLDGSVDALRNGELGDLVDPSNIDEIKNIMYQKLTSTKKTVDQKIELQKKVINYFSFDVFRNKLSEILLK